jgi:hypothetical protein
MSATTTRRPPSKAEYERQVASWNEKHAIGASVTVTTDNGQRISTVTRSAAQMLSGHTAVIFVEGIAGAYLLSRVRAN